MAVLQPNGELNGILVNDQDRDQKVVLQIRGRQLTGRQVAVHQPPEAGADIQRIPMIKGEYFGAASGECSSGIERVCEGDNQDPIGIKAQPRWN